MLRESVALKPGGGGGGFLYQGKEDEKEQTFLRHHVFYMSLSTSTGVAVGFRRDFTLTQEEETNYRVCGNRSTCRLRVIALESSIRRRRIYLSRSQICHQFVCRPLCFTLSRSEKFTRYKYGQCGVPFIVVGKNRTFHVCVLSRTSCLAEDAACQKF